MQVNTEIWGNGFANFWGYNVRTGATDLTDNDYTDYPPFVLNNILPTSPEGYTDVNYTLRAALLTGKFHLREPLPDLSIAYVGCKNPNLLRVGCWGTTRDAEYQQYSGPGVDWCFHDDIEKPKPIVFVCDKRLLEQKAAHSNYTQLSPGLFRNPLYKTSQGVYSNGQYYYAPESRDGYGSTWQNCNATLDMAYYRSFGIRAIFGVIHVLYYDVNNTSADGSPAQSYNVSLNQYKANTDTWKDNHPIIGAYMQVYYRSNVNGTYTAATTNAYGSITVDMTLNMIVDREQTGYLADNNDVIAPCLNVGDNVTHTQLPLFGCLGTQFKLTMGTNTTDGGMSSLNYAMFVGYNMTSVSQGSGSAANTRVCWVELYLGNHAANEDFLMQSAAAYGLFFTDGDPTETGYADLFAAGHDTDRWTNEKMCLGVVDNSGFTDGTYTRGSANSTAPNYGWKDSTQSPYDPAHPPTPTMSYDSTTTFNDISNIATLTRRYALTKQNVEDLGSELWQISSDIINNIQNDEWYKYTADVMDTFLVTDPLSCIVSLQKYPLTIPEQSGPVNIKLGKAETSISANITKATAKTYYFTPVKIQPRFGNSFMDYEPYTHFELYVPFCGTTELDPRDILGRNLAVNLVVDFNTGTCVAYVLSDSLVIETINGSLAIDIPVTGVDSTTIASNITQGIINTRNARYTHQFGTLGKIASPSGWVSNVGNVWGSAQTILTSEFNAKLSEYELTHQPAQPHVIGSASPVGSWAIDFKCRLLIYYPTGGIVDESKVADSSQPTAFDSIVFEQYQSQIGFATVDPVSSLGASYAHGLVCAEKAILNNVTTPNGRPATEPELQLIRQALQEGVILP